MVGEACPSRSVLKVTGKRRTVARRRATRMMHDGFLHVRGLPVTESERG